MVTKKCFKDKITKTESDNINYNSLDILYPIFIFEYKILNALIKKINICLEF